MADQEYTRLHITPLTPALLTTILPPSILPNARNISYHDIQTFPERAYGYVELPTMDADKIKKKLHGSILKGTKVRVETARPVTEHVAEAPEDAPKKPKKEKHKKRKRDELMAVDIGERQVKRGWTVPATLISKEKEKKKGGMINKSKYTTAPECLFKTVLPPNVASKESVKEAKSAKGGSAKGKEAVVHEFAKATKYATFLRSSSGSAKKKTVSEFVKGKGWVDEDGNIVEAIKGGTVTATKKPGLDDMDIDESESSSDDDVPTRAEKAMESTKAEEQTLAKQFLESKEDSSSHDSSSEEEEEEEEEPAKPEPTPEVTKTAVIAPEPSSSDSSSEDEVEEEKENIQAPATPAAKKTASPPSDSSDSDSTDSSESSSDSEAEPSPSAKAASRPQSSSALYKRPAPSLTSTPAAKTSAPAAFSFFGADIDEDAEMEDQPQVPLTPFTQKDFEFRGMRSAAPTPDTAHANKRFIWPTDQDEDEEDEEEPDAASTPMASKGKDAEVTGTGGDETDFQKWFYEHRGEANRAWKKRRKVVAKEVRQRENRKRQERI